jgi:ferritin-like metal-binding protein YciE
MAGFSSLDELLEDELRDIYDAEKQLTKALPKLVKKATSPELKQAFEDHLQETEQHIERLEQAFEELGKTARGKKCEGMQHLIGEGEDMIGEAKSDSVRDAVIIASAQKVEHYEISAYGTARTWASVLGKDAVVSLLEETLEEEKAADTKLTSIAESFVNTAAASEQGEGEEEEEEETARAGARGGSRQARTMRGSRNQRSQAADRKRKRSR